MKKPDQQKIVKQLSCCLIEKYNAFKVIHIEYEKKETKNFQPLDIIYKLTKDFVILLLISHLPILFTIYVLLKWQEPLKYSRAIIASTFLLITKRNLKDT